MYSNRIIRGEACYCITESGYNKSKMHAWVVMQKIGSSILYQPADTHYATHWTQTQA
jgi:hypothetical protein